ncbi:hypothetical protein CCP3SC15_360012 [Gammaproteobacteria bacterium]
MSQQEKTVAQLKKLTDALIRIGDLPLEFNTRARAIAQEAINNAVKDFDLPQGVAWWDPMTPEQFHKILYRDKMHRPASAEKIKEMEEMIMNSKKTEQTPAEKPQGDAQDRPGSTNDLPAYQPPAIEMIPVESSNVESIGHDGDKVLRIKFKNSGLAAYDYVGIMPEDFFGLVNSDSVGKAYNALVKEREIKGIKIEVPE